MSTSSLINHIVTNTPEKISDSGVILTGISDHSLVFAIRKISVIKKQEHTVQIRNMKNFNEEKFIAELSKQEWEYVYFFADDPNALWEIWKRIFSEVLDKHAPLQHKKLHSKKVPWITNNIKKLIIQSLLHSNLLWSVMSIGFYLVFQAIKLLALTRFFLKLLK